MAYFDIEDRRAYQRRWRAANREKLNAYARAYRARLIAKHPSHLREYKRAYDLKRKYGLTEAKFQAILEGQGGGCAICRAKNQHWQVDHCHRTKKVRGVLCSPCNTGLGLLKENPVALRRAARYLTGRK